jgi:hypothetical protein
MLEHAQEVLVLLERDWFYLHSVSARLGFLVFNLSFG